MSALPPKFGTGKAHMKSHKFHCTCGAYIVIYGKWLKKHKYCFKCGLKICLRMQHKAKG